MMTDGQNPSNRSHRLFALPTILDIRTLLS